MYRFYNEIKSCFTAITAYYTVDLRCILAFSTIMLLTFHLLPVVNYPFQKRWLINVREGTPISLLNKLTMGFGPWQQL